MHMPQGAIVRPLVEPGDFSYEEPRMRRTEDASRCGARNAILSRATDARDDIFVNVLILIAKACRHATTDAPPQCTITTVDKLSGQVFASLNMPGSSRCRWSSL